jgi:hypothetical protein
LIGIIEGDKEINGDKRLYTLINNKGEMSKYLAHRFEGPYPVEAIPGIRQCDNEGCHNLICPDEPDAFFLHHERLGVMVCSIKCQDQWQTKQDFYNLNPDLKGESNGKSNILQSGRTIPTPTGDI